MLLSLIKITFGELLKKEIVVRKVGKSSGLERGSSADGRERGERERERERSIFLVNYSCILEGGLLCDEDERRDQKRSRPLRGRLRAQKTMYEICGASFWRLQWDGGIVMGKLQDWLWIWGFGKRWVGRLVLERSGSWDG